MIDELMKVMEESKEQMKSFMANFGGVPDGYDEIVTSTFQMYRIHNPIYLHLIVFHVGFHYSHAKSWSCQAVGHLKFRSFHHSGK